MGATIAAALFPLKTVLTENVDEVIASCILFYCIKYQ